MIDSNGVVGLIDQTFASFLKNIENFSQALDIGLKLNHENVIGLAIDESFELVIKYRIKAG